MPAEKHPAGSYCQLISHRTASVVGLKEAVTGERMLAMPGFRANTAVNLGNRGMTILVADDKAASDKILTMQADWVRTNHPDWISRTSPDVLEGTAIVRILAAGVLA